MSKQAFEEANEIFVDDRFEEAHELYTKALIEDDKVDIEFTSKVLAARAQCALKLKKYSDALNDSDDAIHLNAKNVKAYLRKGTALFHQSRKGEALKTFINGLDVDPSDEQLKVWKEKCEKDLENNKEQATTVSTETSKAAAAANIEQTKSTVTNAAATLAPAKIKHSFYQTDSIVTIQIPIKGLKKEQVQVQTTDSTLNVGTKIPATGGDYSLELDLAFPIDSSRTSFNVTSLNIEIKLYKRQAIQWTSLDAKSSAGKALPPEKAPSYPSSSQRAKNWDQIEAQIKKDEKDNKDDTGDANAIFQQLYRDSDENTRRAMNKSMYESGGTCLNMNWEEVSKNKVSCEPPDGMEWKKYDS